LTGLPSSPFAQTRLRWLLRFHNFISSPVSRVRQPIIDYRCDDGKKVGESRGDIGAIS
jgi:hypothetical protein